MGLGISRPVASAPVAVSGRRRCGIELVGIKRSLAFPAAAVWCSGILALGISKKVAATGRIVGSV